MAVYCAERGEFVPYLTCLDCEGCKKEHKTKREEMLALLSDLVGKLSISESKHTKEEFQSTYAKAYHGLREKIKDVSIMVIQETIYGVRYEIDDLTEEELAPVQTIINDVGNYASIILFKHKDVGLFELVLDHSAKLVQSMLGDIWVARQKG